MALSRTARLVARVLVLGASGIVAACGFTGVGTAPATADLEAGDGAARDGNPALGEGGASIVGVEGGGTEDALAHDGPFMCPSVCTTCTATTCNILCDLGHTCATPITCPPGLACHVTCDLYDACSNRTISCANASSCSVECTQVGACQTMGVDCGSGACRVDCTGPGAYECRSVNLSAANAASLCLKCDPFVGQPGCTATNGAPPSGKPCHLVCGGGGCNATENGLNSCTQTATCP